MMAALLLLVVGCVLTTNVVLGEDFPDAECMVSKIKCSWHDWCHNMVACDKPGLQPPNFCDPGMCGQNCQWFCPPNCHGGSKACNRNHCTCSDGCQDWYMGPMCNILIEKPNITELSAFTAESISGTEVKVSWETPGALPRDMAKHYGYIIEYKEESEPYFKERVYLKHDAHAYEQSTVIRGLHPDMPHEFRGGVFRSHGDLLEVTPWRSHVTTEKTHCLPPDPVTDVSIIATSSDQPSGSMTVRWKTGLSGCGAITIVEVQFRLVGDIEWSAYNVSPPTTTSEVIFTGLACGHYEFVIYVWNDDNLSSQTGVYSERIVDACSSLRSLLYGIFSLAKLIGSMLLTAALLYKWTDIIRHSQWILKELKLVPTHLMLMLSELKNKINDMIRLK